MLTETDMKIIQHLQGDIPLQSRPYAELADSLGINEEQLVQRIQLLHNQGIIRRLAAVLRHQQAGFVVNAMVAWQVDVEKADEVGQGFARHSRVSHCYLRQVPENFDYNLFTMIHARSRTELESLIKELSSQMGITQYTVLESLHEYKKTSMTYF